MERISQYLSVERNFWCVRIAIASAILHEDQKICHGYGLLSKSARDGRGNDSIEKAVGLDLAGGAPGEMNCVINSVRRTEFINSLRRITGGFLHSKAIYRLSSFGPAVRITADKIKVKIKLGRLGMSKTIDTWLAENCTEIKSRRKPQLCGERKITEPDNNMEDKTVESTADLTTNIAGGLINLVATSPTVLTDLYNMATNTDVTIVIGSDGSVRNSYCFIFHVVIRFCNFPFATQLWFSSGFNFCTILRQPCVNRFAHS